MAGLVLAQLIREGAPVILGCLPASFDMRTMGSYYGPETMLLNLACGEMMAHYGLPHCGTSGSGGGWGADLLAADGFWLNHLTSCVGAVGLAPFVGGNFDSLVFSPAAAVYADQIIGQARRFAEGFTLDPAAAGLGEIDQVGPGGNFLTADLTLRHFREADFRSPIFPRLSLEAWQAQGSSKAGDLLRERTVDLLAHAPPPEDHPELMARGEALIRAWTGGIGWLTGYKLAVAVLRSEQEHYAVSGAASGMRTRICVPQSGALTISRVPPTSCTRSRIERSPRWPG